MALTHLPLDKMAAILADDIFKCVFLNENDIIPIQMSNWQKVIIGSSNGLAPNRRQAITWTNDGPVHWRIYAVLGGDELNTLYRSDVI